MNRQILSFLAIGLLATGLSGGPARVEASNVNLESLCHDKSSVQLTRISEARNLIQESRNAPVESCNKYMGSLEQLDDILAVVQSGAICNLDFVDKIRQYHQTFIDSSSDENKASRESIPKPVRHFFISLCFQISAECKMALINNLEYDTKGTITEEDYAQIKFLERYGATLLDEGTELGDFDDVLLLSDMASLSDVQEDTGESKMVIKVKTNQMMRKLVANCNNKFKPYYDKLIMPLIRLSNLGYNYQGELLERELKELKQNSLVKRWYNIVQTCEIFRGFEIFEDPEMETTDDNRQMLTFISKGEVEQLRQRNVKSIEEELEDSPTALVERAITYEPIASHNDDELWIKDQKELERLVVKYKASSSEADRVRHKLFKKMLAKIKDTLRSGKVFLFASELAKSGMGSSSTSVNEEMLAMMDEAVEQEEIEEGHAPADPRDGSVSGFNSKVARGVVSKAGPASRVKAMNVPPRAKYMKIHKNGTKTSVKWYNFAQKVLPKKMNIFMWIIGIVGFLLIILSICTVG